MTINAYFSEITTDSGGDFSQTITVESGKLVAIRYIPDASSPLATGFDIDITDDTGFVVWNQDDAGTSAFDKAPIQQGDDIVDGAAEASQFTPVYVYKELNIVIAQGGNALRGKLIFFIES